MGGAFTCHWCMELDSYLGTDGTGLAAEQVWRDIHECEAGELARSSEATYKQQIKWVVEWAEEALGLDRSEALGGRGPMPELVALGAVAARSKGAAAGTVASLVTAINKWHERRGCASVLNSDRGRAVVKGAKRRAGVGRGAKAPLSSDVVVLLLGALAEAGRGSPSMQGLYHRDAAWLVAGFCGLLRKSEIVQLRREHVRLERDGSGAGQHFVTLYIERSKTDVEGRGAWVTMAARTAGGVPVWRVMRRYLRARDEALGGEGSLPLFPRWDFQRRTLGTQFLAGKGEALNAAMKKHIKRVNQQYGLKLDPGLYASHSMRRGGATAMHAAGVPAQDIQAHGRWSSDCYRRYLEPSMKRRALATARM